MRDSQSEGLAAGDDCPLPVREQNWNEAYLATLPPDRREQERAALAALPQKDLVVTGLGPLVVVPPEGREALERRAQFFAGSVFAGLDRPSFWAPPGRQDEVDESVRVHAELRVQQLPGRGHPR